MKFAEALQSRFHSPKSPETIYGSLCSHTILGDAFWLQKRTGLVSTRDFCGTVGFDRFQISPRIDYRNSFLPIISGTVERDNDGSVVSMRAKMHPFVSWFTIFWVCGVLFFLMVSLTKLFWPGIAGPLFMLAVMGGLLYFGFYRPARKALRRLEELLK